MNVVFFVSGEGFGAIARNMAIADELKKRGHRAILCTYGDCAKKVRNESNFEVVEIHQYLRLVEKHGQLNAVWTTISSMIPFVFSLPAMVKIFFILRKYATDAIVVDAYDICLPVAALSGKPIFSIFNCINPDEICIFPFPRFITKLIGKLRTLIYEKLTSIMICDFSPPNTIARYNVDGFARRITYPGPVSRESPEKLPPVNEIKKRLGLGRFILVTRGKFGKESEISTILESLSKLTKAHTIVVMGDTDSCIGNMIVKKFDYHDYLNYLKACDLVITHGGHSTMMECCIFGKPMILIVADNYWERMGNARGAEELGIAEFIPFSKLTSKILHSAVDRMLKKKPTAQKFKKLAKKENGAERAADIIESTVLMEGLKRKQAQ